MAEKRDDFLKKLLATFRVEADEHLKAMSSGLLELERAPAGARRAQIVEAVFREAHSLKGAARAVNREQVEAVCQSLETIFAQLKNEQLDVSRRLLDLLHEALRTLGGLLAADATASEAKPPEIPALIRRLDGAAEGTLAGGDEPVPAVRGDAVAAPAPPPLAAPAGRNVMTEARPVPPASGPLPGTVRLSTARLDTLMRQAEELLSPRLAATQRAAELREAAGLLAASNKARAGMHPEMRALGRGELPTAAAREQQALRRVLEHLEAEGQFMKMLEDRLQRLGKSAERDRRTLTVVTDALLHEVKEMQMLPLSLLTESLALVARELARDQGKDVRLAASGDEIEIDRKILEELKDPLIHIVRNCIDHGIETPAVREGKGKPPRGRITLAISQKNGGKVEILVADDGAGIDVAKVKAAAVKLGTVSREEAETLSEPTALALVFQSGVSTSPIITELSGRGLGLAIVREKAERLGGAIALESRAGAGTSLRIILPLTLATFRGLLVRTGNQLFVIPASSIDRVIRVPGTDIRTVENRETVPLDGQAVSLVSLSDVLELPRKVRRDGRADHVQAVVLGPGPERLAFRVDEVLGEQEVLVKTLGRQLARVRNVAGASILGTGQVVPVLNASDLVKSAVRLAAPPTAPGAADAEAEPKQRSILVVEDSITARTLLKHILESAGYRVSTAVDGVDAYTALKTGSFDLVVSDVEMPRMDGFDLTAKVRADKQLAELPVVLVTALESREHRERGIDVGANAYLVKSSFDQSNLLEAVRRLI